MAAPPTARLPPFLRGRLFGACLLVVLLAVAAVPGLPGLTRLAFAWLDVCQNLAPRARLTDRVVIVDVDDASLARYGQWPWPRTLLARLLGTLVAARPAAVGLDVVMPEPDRLSPPGLPALVPTIGPELAARLAEVPSNDSILASTLRGRPIVLGMVGIQGAESRPPVRVAPAVSVGGAPVALPRFDAALQSVLAIEIAAAGHGLLNADVDGGAVRRIGLLGDVAGVITPALALELLRVAERGREISLLVDEGRVRRVKAASVVTPTELDGAVWLRYAGHTPARFESAADVLAGVVPRERFDGKLVLVGVTALGLADRRPVPGTGDMDGLEIHAELVESLLDGTLLARPWWAPWARCGFILVGGVLLIATVPVMRARAAALVLAPLLLAAFAASFALYREASVGVDPSTPALALAVMFVAMLGVTLAEAERQRRLLRHQVDLQRDAAARFEGELSAARRIQMGILPKPADVLAGEPRVSVHVVLDPAREVGGDLYDFFMLGGDRLFFLLGDVSGKGLPGSLFMAISKSLYKSTALRYGGDVAAMMRQANLEISRDNPEALFVTVFAGVLNLATGALEYCNAGHDQPYIVSGDGERRGQLDKGGGPPLCVLDDYPYEAATHQLQPGDTVCLVTDGVTEARDASGALFGRARLEQMLATLTAARPPEAGARAIRDAVTRFVAGSEPADDLAILVLRWNGPRASGP
ncbi:MAG TPA: CHASE2 domain-containing protein [Methylomirabilota bacterium]|nr:CHASE2 domain-containing protein [Methylomirabilota bacterium]